MQLNYEYTHENENSNLNLDYWEDMQSAPQCWTYLQKLLCYIKYPECIYSNTNWLVKKLAKEVCLVTARECPLLLSTVKYDNATRSSNVQDSDQSHLVVQTPYFLDCDRYSSNCIIDHHKKLTQIKDQVNCKWPMVKTTEHSLWVRGFSKCSFYCQTPFFSKEEYQQTNSIFGILGIVFFVLNIIVLATLILHQLQHNKYQWHPLLLNLLIVHIYMLISTFGWMMPLLPSIGHSIVCRADGALQIRKPQVKVGEAMWCVLAFSIIYFPLMAGSITSISFFYSVLNVVKNYANCCLNKDIPLDNYYSNEKSFKLPFLSKKLGFTVRKFSRKNKKKQQHIELKEIKPKINEPDTRFPSNGLNLEYSIARHHTLNGQVYVVLISIALLVVSLTIAEIRADPISGMCFISSEFIITRILLSLFPLTVFLVIKSLIIYFVIKHFRTIQKHLTIYASCQQEIHSKRINRTTRYYVFILLFLWTFWTFSVYTHWYIFLNESLWHKALTNDFICKLKQTLSVNLPIFGSDSESSNCRLETKPIINVFILHNISYFSINVVFIISSIFNKHSIYLWKRRFLRCYHKEEEVEPGQDVENSKNIYLGLQNRSLLDAIWNPGVFVYLIKKKQNIKEENWGGRTDEKLATIGSIEDSSASYCIYHQNGSLRSCVSMPPINAASGQNVCGLSEDFSKDSPMCTTLDDFLRVTQSFIGDNSVRRSNSFGGRPFLNSRSCMGNEHIPCSMVHGGSDKQFKSLDNDCNSQNVNCQQKISGQSCCCKNNQNLSQNNCLSLNQISHPAHTDTLVDKTCRKSTKRFSMLLDQRHDTGLSSRSTLSRRKHATQYSVSPKALSKTIMHQSSISNHAPDPASRHSSSFSAESYNSYNLMAQQMGGRWRDICRTRMTLHDAMMWAKTASNSNYHNPMCSHVSDCKHHHQSSASMSQSGYDHHCTPDIVIANNLCQDTDTQPQCSDYEDTVDETSYFIKSHNLDASSKSKSLKGSKISQTSVPFNDSSDEFNSEDEVVSAGNSVKSSDKESGDFCSEDEVVSLIYSDN